MAIEQPISFASEYFSQLPAFYQKRALFSKLLSDEEHWAAHPYPAPAGIVLPRAVWIDDEIVTGTEPN